MVRFAVVASLVLSFLGVALLWIYLRRFELEKSGGAPVAVLVVAAPVKRDSELTESAISVREIPAAYVDSRAVRASEKKRVLGVNVVNALEAGQTLTWTDVAVGGNERRSLSGLVQPGFRAVALRTRSDTASFELVEPGDRVDLIATQTAPGGQRSSSLLLQNVLVLAVGLNTGDEAPGPRVVKNDGRREQVITLSLKIDAAQLLSTALDRGPVSVAVRNPDDVRVVEVTSPAPSTTERAPRSPEERPKREARAAR